MLDIITIYRKFLMFFRQSIPREHITTPQTTEIFGSLCLSLDADAQISVSCTLPDGSNKDSEEIVCLAEEYATLLLCTNDAQFKKIISNTLHDLAKTTENSNEVLLIENILVFWGALYNQYQINQVHQQKINSPIVRPRLVFKVSH